VQTSGGDFVLLQLRMSGGVCSRRKENTMMPRTLEVAGLLLVALFRMAPLAASASPDRSAYQMIAQKNSFRLLPPVVLRAEAPRPTAKIKLQGMTTVLGRPLALLKLTLADNTSEFSVILGQGEQAAGVEVIQINGPSRTVGVSNGGNWQLLFLEEVTAASPWSGRQ
jgi:hypothetical protein